MMEVSYLNNCSSIIPKSPSQLLGRNPWIYVYVYTMYNIYIYILYIIYYILYYIYIYYILYIYIHIILYIYIIIYIYILNYIYNIIYIIYYIYYILYLPTRGSLEDCVKNKCLSRQSRLIHPKSEESLHEIHHINVYKII
jgi:hypothetical protein